MTPEESKFFHKLFELNQDRLRDWILLHLEGFIEPPAAPFLFSGGAPDIPENTLNFLNRVYAYESQDLTVEEGQKETLLYKFETCLVELFRKQARQTFPHLQWLSKFLRIFQNTILRGPANLELVNEVLLPVVAHRKWSSLSFEGRVLHYEAIDVMIEQAAPDNPSFLGTRSIADYLLNSVSTEKHPRFSVLALRYFRETRDPESFFRVFEESFALPGVEKINGMIRELKLFYQKDPSLSMAYLADWLASKQVKCPRNQVSKMHVIYHHQDLFSLVCQRWTDNEEIYLNFNPEEGRHVGAVLLIFLLRKNPNLLQPALIEYFLLNPGAVSENDALREQYGELREDVSADDIRQVLNKKRKGFPAYYRAHIAVLSLLAATKGNIDDFGVKELQTMLIVFTEPNKRNYDMVVVNKTTEQLHILSNNSTDVRISLAGIRPAYDWWQLVDGYSFVNMTI